MLKKTANIIFVLCVCFFSIALTSDLINRYISINTVHYDWPGWSFLDLILYSKGFIQNDFHVISNLNTHKGEIAKLIAIFFPNEHLEIIFSYIKLNLLSHLLIAISFFILFYKLVSYKISFNLSRITTLLITFSICYLYFIINYKFNYQDINLYLKPPNIGWQFYPSDSFDTYAISLILTNFLSIFLIHRAQKKKFNINIGFILLLFLITFIHPIHVFFIFFIIVILFLTDLDLEELKKTGFINYLKNSYYSKLFLESLLVTLTSIFIYKLVFISNFSFENGELYRIYVDDRHPHHYKPSNYLGNLDWSHFSKNLLFFSLISIVMWAKSNLARSLFITGIISFIFLNTIQFVFVEYLKLEFFTLLGISRFMWIYHFCYLANLILITTFIFYYLCKMFSNMTLQIFSIQKINFFHLLKYFRGKYNISTSISSCDFIIIFKKYYSQIIMLIIIFFSINKININLNNFKQFLSDQQYFLQKNEFVNLKEIIIKNNLSDTVFITDLSIPTFRELSLVNIFSDKAFSFDLKYMREWQYRKKINKKFFTCLRKDKAITNECKKILPSNHFVIVASSDLLIDNTPIIENFFFDGNYVNFYSLNVD